MCVEGGTCLHACMRVAPPLHDPNAETQVQPAPLREASEFLTMTRHMHTACMRIHTDTRIANKAHTTRDERVALRQVTGMVMSTPHTEKAQATEDMSILNANGNGQQALTVSNWALICAINVLITARVDTGHHQPPHPLRKPALSSAAILAEKYVKTNRDGLQPQAESCYGSNSSFTKAHKHNKTKRKRKLQSEKQQLGRVSSKLPRTGFLGCALAQPVEARDPRLIVIFPDFGHRSGGGSVDFQDSQPVYCVCVRVCVCARVCLRPHEARYTQTTLGCLFVRFMCVCARACARLPVQHALGLSLQNQFGHCSHSRCVLVVLQDLL